MKIVLVALNAQYTHTALAVRSLAGYAMQQAGIAIDIIECNINQTADSILQKLVFANAQVYLFSCYIWNVGQICTCAAQLHKLLPKAILAAGGPQAFCQAEEFLMQNPAFSAVLCGEGEQCLVQWLRTIKNRGNWQHCPGLCLRTAAGPVKTPGAALPHMDSLPLAYQGEVGEDSLLQNRILYYESMRGCPYSCSYCFSGMQGGAVRMKSLKKVYAELRWFLSKNVRRVKFVDRTFNCNTKRALSIWRFLAKNDNGCTNFHFEICAQLLNEESLVFLSGLRPGLFQLEIGVQSTNSSTLKAVSRPGSQQLLLKNTLRLRSAGNIHLHLDLIAGLPHEGYASFAKTFNTVHALHPHQLQLGFLKLLPGSALKAQAAEYGILYSDAPPFEVLQSKWLSYRQLAQLKQVAAMVEVYHNSARFENMLAYLCAGYSTAFAFYEKLAAYYAQCGHFETPAGKWQQYSILAAFARHSGLKGSTHLQWLCRLDIALQEKPHSLPAFVQVGAAQGHRQAALNFYKNKENLQKYLPQYINCDAKQILKQAHIELFPYNPITGAKGECAFLFNYALRDANGHAQYREICITGTAGGK